MEVPESPTPVGQKHRRSSDPALEVERKEYYLRPTLDALEDAIPPRQWGEQKGVPFEYHVAQLEPSTATVSLEVALFSYDLSLRLYLIGLPIFRS